MRLSVVLAIARSEARLTRRLVRYWVFTILAVIFGIGVYLSDALIHWFASSWSGTVAALSPQYLMARYSATFLTMFMIGAVFLGFDTRARDIRERIFEVLDCRPISNLELLGGRFLGILLMGWIPAALLTLVLWIVGSILGESIQSRSLLEFITVMTIPALSLMLGLVFLVSLGVRHRLVAAVILVPMPIVFLFGGFPFPNYLGPVFNITGVFETGYPSDLVWLGGSPWGLAQRAAVFMVGLGLLALAAAIHPRLDGGSRGRRAGAGVLLLVLSVLLVAGEVAKNKRFVDLTERWHEVHAARTGEPVPDLTSIEGEVRAEPGRRLELDLLVSFRSPTDRTLERASFSLNPGLAIEGVATEGGETLQAVFEDGLLDIDLPVPLAPGEETSVRLQARGIPDPRFAYLDAARHPLSMTGRDGALFILGLMPLAFERQYVALLPGAVWLPAPGPEVGRDDVRTRPRDFFMLDLTVDLPEGWLAAGPGRRHEVDDAPQGRVRYRYRPPAPVPEVGLIASRFESRSAEVAGVQMEVLVHPSHAKNLDEFADASSEIVAWLEERLGDAAELGLEYPYDALTAVEIPNGLRVYGGGWRMDTTMAPPGMVLMREVGFPLAHFGGPLWKADDAEDKEGGVARYKRDGLLRFFENDFNGGNPFLGAARNFFAYQTGARGDSGLPLNFTLDTLVSELITGKRGYFSAHIFDRGFEQVINNSMGRLFQGGGRADVVGAVLDAQLSRPAVWDTVLNVSLTRLDPWEDPGRTLDVLSLKGGSIATSIVDGLGRENTGALLASLRSQHLGGSFDREDFTAAGQGMNEDLGAMLDVWLDETALPGFIVEDVRAYRLPDEEDGSPRYQVRFVLRNDEPAPGVVVVRSRAGSGAHAEESTDPILVARQSAVEVGLIRSARPDSVTVVPYLALNRGPFTVVVPAIDEERIERSEPLRGSRPVSVSAQAVGEIVVDDLDDGFRVEETAKRPWWRLGARSGDEETDHGLPVLAFGNPPSRWSRTPSERAYGKYRHTAVVIRGGRGLQRAIFAAEVPGPGAWELDLHLPNKSGQFGLLASKRGTWHLTIEDGADSYDVTFDADSAEDGWNSLGSYELSGGEVRLVLADDTDGRVVIADAIRWRPGSGAAHGGGS